MASGSDGHRCQTARQTKNSNSFHLRLHAIGPEGCPVGASRVPAKNAEAMSCQQVITNAAGSDWAVTDDSREEERRNFGRVILAWRFRQLSV